MKKVGPTKTEIELNTLKDIVQLALVGKSLKWINSQSYQMPTIVEIESVGVDNPESIYSDRIILKMKLEYTRNKKTFHKSVEFLDDDIIVIES